MPTALSLLASALLALAPPSTAAAPAKAPAAPLAPRLSAKTLEGLKLRNIGPALMSGRIADVAIDPTSASTWYVGGRLRWRLEDGERGHDVDAAVRQPGLRTRSAA